MAAENSSRSEQPDRLSIAKLLSQVDCVLFDFDGPLCLLFAQHPTPEIAQRFRILLADAGLLKDSLVGCEDPFRILHENHDMPGSTDLIAPLLVQEEIAAAHQAEPTSGSLRLVAALAERHVPMAITTNNSPEAVRIYLDRHGLSEALAEHVYGRGENPALMKPDPFCIDQAMTALGIPADRCLMIGDSPADVVAARDAGVWFLGYARNEDKRHQLHASDALVYTIDEFHEQVLLHWPAG